MRLCGPQVTEIKENCERNTVKKRESVRRWVGREAPLVCRAGSERRDRLANDILI